MRLLLISLTVLLAAVSIQAGKKSILLGADDVDKKAADTLSGNKVEVAPHKNLREIKKMAQDDRVKIKQMQSKVRELKTALTVQSKTKSEKKALKKEFRELKQTLHTKKAELSELKTEMKVKKEEKKGKPFRGSGNAQKTGNEDAAKDQLFLEEKKELSLLLPVTSKPTPKPEPQSTTVADLLALNKKVARRKSQRRNYKKNNKKGKNKNKDVLNTMQSDQPLLPLRQQLSRNRKACSTDADCTAAGTKCKQNKKGHKYCKFPHGKNKPAGRKCHSSEQCAEGLQCFVTLSSEQQHHKKHPRRGKGTCADPETTDTSKGKFMPKAKQ